MLLLAAFCAAVRTLQEFLRLFRLMTNEKTNIKLLKRALRAGRLASTLRAKIGSWLLKATAPSDRQRCRATGILDDVR